MSPALVDKYLDAAKQVAAHVVLLPAGVQFSPDKSRRDWIDQYLQRIRAFYQRFVDDQGTYLDWERKNADAARAVVASRCAPISGPAFNTAMPCGRDRFRLSMSLAAPNWG